MVMEILQLIVVILILLVLAGISSELNALNKNAFRIQQVLSSPHKKVHFTENFR